ncbi:serine/arginine repetitive matrix protein 1-like [Hyalella azteca]|uniref:Serine/arginine repetitive matrix protein 1-like n=1 Tax=Hyalella azteca TaxID=294128 RepID=A0A8B7PCE8_HYAAZ|nr:serine/arginine repetitive matrix protein 1-like [Hyalella azteca]
MGRWQCAVVVTVVLHLLHPVAGRSELAILNDIDTRINNIARYLDLFEHEATTTSTQIVTTTAESTTEPSVTTVTAESTSSTESTESTVKRVQGAEKEVISIHDDEPHDELILEIQKDPSLMDGWQTQVKASEDLVSAKADAAKDTQTIIIVSSVLGGVLLIVSVAFIGYVIHVQQSKKKKPKQPNLANKQNVALEMTERGEELGVDNLAMATSAPFDNGNNRPPPSSAIPEAGNFAPERDIPRQSIAGIQSSNAAADADARLSRFEVNGKKPMSTYGSPYDAPRDRSPPPRSQSRTRPSEYRDPPRESRMNEYPRAYPPPSRDHRPPPPRGSSHPPRNSSSNRPPSPSNRRRHESPRGPYDAPPRGYAQPRPAPEDYRDSRRPPSNYRSSNDMASPRAAPPSSKQPRPDRRDFRGPYGPEDLY